VIREKAARAAFSSSVPGRDRSGGLLRVLLGLGRDDAALQHLHLRAELAVVGAEQVGVDAAIVLDRLDAARREAQADRMAERIRQDRGDLQVRHEPALRLVVRVAHIVAVLDGLARQGATTRHGGFR